MSQFAKTLEWISYLTPLIEIRYKIKNCAQILAPGIFFLKMFVFLDQNEDKIYERYGVELEQIAAYFLQPGHENLNETLIGT